MISGTIGTLFTDGLQYLHGAHQQGATQAAANVRASTSPKLRAMLKTGAKRNRAQARRLEKVFKVAGLRPDGRKDPAMQGIVDANDALVAQAPDPVARDLVNIASGQVAAHFYLATYGTLRSYAQLLGHKKAARLLGKTLGETGTLDRTFTRLARRLSRQSGAAGDDAAGRKGGKRPVATVVAMLGGIAVAALATAGSSRRPD